MEIKYRGWYKFLPPRPTKLQIPGWAGDSQGHGNGDKPQPWHCTPFVEASTYGLELIYPFDTECHVVNTGSKIQFLGDFSAEQPHCNIQFPPFQVFAEKHYGYTSALDIQAPPGYVLRIEPHPRFYTDDSGTCPIPVAGHLQTEWWPKIFFIVFKHPKPGETHIFRHGEPYAQILFVPKKVNYEIREMTANEQSIRQKLSDDIDKNGKNIKNHEWKDWKGNVFTDSYKVVRRAFEAEGMEGVNKLIDRTTPCEEVKKPTTAIGRFVPVKKELA